MTVINLPEHLVVRERIRAWKAFAHTESVRLRADVAAWIHDGSLGGLCQLGFRKGDIMHATLLFERQDDAALFKLR